MRELAKRLEAESAVFRGCGLALLGTAQCDDLSALLREAAAVIRRVAEAPVGVVASFPVGQNVSEVGVRISALEQCTWDNGQRVRLVIDGAGEG